MPVLIPSANPLIHKPCINESIRLPHIPAIHDNRMSLSGQLLQLPGIQRINTACGLQRSRYVHTHYGRILLL